MHCFWLMEQILPRLLLSSWRSSAYLRSCEERCALSLSRGVLQWIVGGWILFGWLQQTNTAACLSYKAAIQNPSQVNIIQFGLDKGHNLSAPVVSQSQLSPLVGPKHEEAARLGDDGGVLVAAAQVHDGVTLDPELRRSIVRKFWPEEKSLNNHKK